MRDTSLARTGRRGILVALGVLLVVVTLAPSVHADPPPVPVLIAPQGPTANATPAYTWYAVAGATQYYVEVDNSTAPAFLGLFTSAQLCSGATCTLVANTLAAGPYTWWVQAQNPSGKTWSDGMAFSVEAPPAPVLASPSGSIVNPTPTYAWNPSAGATQYFVQVGNGSAIVAQGLYDTGQVCAATCAVALGNPLTIGSYWWAVQAKNPAGGTWSPNMNFSVQGPPAPVLAAPSGAIATPAPTYTWNASAGATQYFVQVGNGSAIVSQGLFDTSQVCNGATCAAAFGQTLVIGSYWWAVQAKTTAGGTWSPNMNFSVQGPQAPVLTAPSGAITTPTPTYAWTASSGASQYFVQVGNGATIVSQGLFGTSQVCAGATCAATFSQALATGSYWWAVQAKTAAGGTWSPNLNFSVQGPPAPVLTTPSGSVSTPTPTYTWSASSGATSYFVQVGTSAGTVFQGLYTSGQVCSGSACSLTPATVLTLGPYTWGVQAKNSAGGTWGTDMAFTVQPPPAPTLLSPNGQMTAAAPTYTWSKSSGATQYFLEVDRPDGSVVLQRLFDTATVCSASTCAATTGVVLAGGPYSWSVQAKHAGGGSWSAAKVFTVFGCSEDAVTGDFNGDGLTDRLCSDTGGTYVSLSTPSGFATATTWLSASLGKPLVGDFDSDGRADVAKFDSATGVFSVALSTGTAFGPLQSWKTAVASQGGVPRTCLGADATADVGDFNGDGRTDVSCKLRTWDGVFVGLSSGSSASGFSFSIFGNAFCDGAERTGTLDVNGDGKDDWYCLGVTNDTMLVFRSTGTSFVSPGVSAGDSSFCDDASYVIGDFNGDGRADIACTTNGKVRLSTGNAYLEVGRFGGWCTDPTNTSWPFAFAADVDGDGAAEMVCSGKGVINPITHVSTGANLQVRRWLGNTLGPVEPWLGGFCSGTVRAGDFNGDGKLDLLCDSNGRMASAGTPNIRADIMTKAKSPLGGLTQAAYTTSTAFPNQPGLAGRPLVTAVTVSDGRGGSSRTSYNYAGGKVDRQERVFLGFQSTRTTLPCLVGESPCPYVVSTFSQTLASAGAPLDVKRYDGSGRLLSRQTYQYVDTLTLPRKSILQQSNAFTYDSSGASKQTSATYAYDVYGNQIQVLMGGDAASSGDEIETDLTYVPNTTAYIVGLAAKIERRVPGQAALQTEYLEYDLPAAWPALANWNHAPTKGDLTAVGRHLDYGNKDVTRRMTYNAQGSVLTSTDETGRTVTTDYDPVYNMFVAHVTNAVPESTSFAWDVGCAVPLATTDPNNQTTGQTYDALCRPSRTTIPLGGYVQRYYLNLGDPSAQRTRVETPAPTGVSGAAWSEEYFDGLGRSYRGASRGPSSGQDIVVETTFNPRGGADSSTEPFYEADAPRVTRSEYDSLDRIVRVTVPDGTDVETSYGIRSQTLTDANGRTATTSADAYGRVTSVSRVFNGQTVATSTTYDVLGRRKTLSDAAATWRWAPDSLGRVYDEQDPDAGHWTYEYDDADRPVKQTDAKGQQTMMTYDSAGRIKTRVSPVGTVTYTYGEARSGYYNVGRLTTITSPADTLKLDYDALGRAVRQQRIIGGTTYQATKTYDAGGYLQTTTFPDSDVVGPIGYDEAGRIQSIPGIVADVDYDAAGRPTQKKDADSSGTTTMWSYRADNGLLERILTRKASTTLQDLGYTYYADGSVKDATSVIAGEGWHYTYDDFYHLASATNLASPTDNQTFIFDSADRITYNSRVGTYTYPSSGQARPHAPATVNGSSYGYDPNGSLTSGNGRTLTWNADNQITQAVAGTTMATFTYDAFGERIKKASGSNTSTYPFGDDYEIANGTITKYISVEGLGVVAKRVGAGTGATTYWLHTDRLGSIQSVTNVAGTEVFHRKYRPFGETLSQSGTSNDFRGWIDQRNDTETGLTYLHARYFDPKLGTFLSPDPLGAAGGLNQYAYGAGDPVNLTDRSGLLPCVPGASYTFCNGTPDTPGTPGQPGFNIGPGTSFNLGKAIHDFFCLFFCGGHPQQPNSKNYVPVVSQPPPGVPFSGAPAHPPAPGQPPVPPPPPPPPGPPLTPNDSQPQLFVPPWEVRRALVPIDASDALGDLVLGMDFMMASCIPGVGECMDVATLADPESSWFDRAAAGVSLGVNGLEFLPNYGAFRSFRAFKRAMGPAGHQLNWHHVVEQTAGNVARFGPHAIHNASNLTRLDVATHTKISSFYSSKMANGQTVRQWLSTQSFAEQTAFGQDVLRRFGATP